ncbi:efflux RND transporter permease subunit [Limnoglobus roseus]|uniref:Multidrug efflux RND transporter permease subunit n=1 Tax=Limnoglobus roseus TaxID=2598579 RepID=A0A5C1ALC5_9BACT|nr:multidrug efflux RND transporter permease subunit [Limnoglobus roseus]QEL20209.1 multidrug efflux RND transporter permease subunit [Limnoglobus roseus]
MISRFFIDRPIFANVLAILTMLFGVVALQRLPIEQYPSITPPTVIVTTSYPGANAKIVADTVAAPLEQEVNGVENMMYMSSTSSADGSYQLTITFEIGTNLDTAQVLVQNRLAVAQPRLPAEVRQQGVTVKKQSSNILLVISLTSQDKTFPPIFLSNFATLQLRDQLSRVAGVGEVTVKGAGNYSMRVWIDPDKMAARGLTTKDVEAALARQNVQAATGQIGQPPVGNGQAFQLTVTTLGRLTDVRQFEEIVVKSGAGGQIVYLRDVARVELGAQTYDSFETRSGMAAANLLVYQLPGSNALDVAKRVEKTMLEDIGPTLPKGMEYTIPFNTTKFVDSAITNVYSTILEAGGLVLIVILIFLQSWRALLVPATTVPVTIIGAFAFMYLFGFSINLLTLFGLILAIGIVVDDAIVIVENAAHHIENGESPRNATIKAMNEVTGPVIAITFVLLAVFIPTAFLGGITGQMYRQFALTIAATAVISAVNALTLKPAQCAAYLRPHAGKNFFTKIFDFFYKPVERLYDWFVRQLVKVWWLVLVLFVGVGVLTTNWYRAIPTGFLPEEDQGYVIVAVQLPDSASLERTREVADKLNEVLARYKERGMVENWFVLGGLSLLDGTAAPNGATAFIAWTDWSQRTKPEESQTALKNAIQGELFGFKEANIFVIIPPSIMGLGFSGGFEMKIEDKGGVGSDTLQERTQAIITEAIKNPEILPPPAIRSTFRAGVPQIYLDIDRVKAEKMGVLLSDVFAALQANLGSIYVNDFNVFDRTYQVRVQADAFFRGDTRLLRRLEVRNQRGDRVPLATLLTAEVRVGPQSIMRYNLYPSATISGGTAPGFSSGQALDVMERTAGQVLPQTMGYEWTSIAHQEKRLAPQPHEILGYQFTLSESVVVFGLAVFLVYLVLAAQYESWLLPLAVILVVPLGIFGVVAGVKIRGLDNNIYTQIGVVLIIALASKNAILIVEFARELRMAGRSIREAATTAARMRFRPILMTSIAFILGVVPLVFATGAGAASRRSLGTAVFGGMISSTVLAVFFVPAFYVAIQTLIELINGPSKPKNEEEKKHAEEVALSVAPQEPAHAVAE